MNVTTEHAQPTRDAPPLARAPARFLISLAVCAAALGLFRLAHKGIWLDEASSAAFALGGAPTWFADHNMGLYYALLGVWTQCFGLSEWALRAPSALLFCASACVFFCLARDLYGERVARFAGAAFVLDATVVHFAQEARGYMLALFFVVAASWAIVRLIRRPSYALATLAAACMIAGAYSHLFVLLVIGAHAVTLLICVWQRRLSARHAAWALGCTCAGVAPLLVAVAGVGGTQISWLSPPTPRNVWASFSFWLGGGSLLPCLALAVAAAWFACWRASGRPASLRQYPHVLVLLWCVVPLGLAYGVSIIFTPLVHPKYLLVVIPALLLAGAKALNALPRTPWSRALAVLWLLTSLQRLYTWYADYEKEPWREAAHYLLAHAKPGDGVMFDMPHPDALDYYVLRGAAPLPALIFPRRAWRFPSNDEPDASPLSARETAFPRIWLLENRNTPVLSAQLRTSHEVARVIALEPDDEDGASLFASSAGRIVTITLFTRKHAFP